MRVAATGCYAAFVIGTFERNAVTTHRNGLRRQARIASIHVIPENSSKDPLGLGSRPLLRDRWPGDSAGIRNRATDLEIVPAGTPGRIYGTPYRENDALLRRRMVNP